MTQIMRAGIIGSLHVVDVRSSDRGDFRYDLTGDVMPFKAPSFAATAEPAGMWPIAEWQFAGDKKR